MSPFPQLGCISIKTYSCVEYAAFLCVDLWNILDSSCAVQELLWLQFACRPHTSSKSHLTRCSSSWLLYPKPEYSNCVICTSSLNPPKLALLGSWVVANMFHTHQVISLCLTNAFNLLLTENSEFISSVCWHTGDNRFVCVCVKVRRITYILYLCSNLWHLYSVCILLQLRSFQFTGNNLYWDKWRRLSISMTQQDERFWWLLPNLCITAVK